MRVALGAGRWRIVRYLAAESVVLGTLGVDRGLIAGAWLIRLLPALLGTPPGLRSFLVFESDTRVMLFTGAVAAATTVLFGLAPAWIAARTDVVPVTRGAGGAVHHGGAVNRVLVATSLVLLCVAAVLARSYAATQRADIGFTRRPLLTLWVLRDGLLLGVTGVAAGLPLALAATHFTASMLVGVEAWDAPAFVASAAVMLLGVGVAAVIPASRAARLDPASTLRS